MPGISLVCNFNKMLMRDSAGIQQALDSIKFDDRYEKQIYRDGKYYILASSKYDQYPLRSYENDNYLIYLEGIIYDKEFFSLEDELYKLARCLFDQSEVPYDQLSKWTLDADGDYILIFIEKKSDRIAIMNDAMAHLPLYYYRADSCLIASRDIGFVASLIGKTAFDEKAVAQYLLFRHTLGNKTLLKDVFRCEPSTLIEINPETRRYKAQTFHQYNFEDKGKTHANIKENATNLASLFASACKNRVMESDQWINILGLSGGLDSRAVAAGLSLQNVPFLGVTRLRHNNQESLEVKLAGEVAGTLNFPWQHFRIRPTKGKDLLRLLRIKYGMNYLASSFNLPFFDEIIKTYGSKVRYFTGDMGLVTMKNHCPAKRLRNLDDLADYILYKNSFFTVDVLERLLGIKKGETKEILIEHLREYPETSMAQKNVHFQIFEKGFNWGFEGMDRNRYYFWLATPLLSTKVFRYSMSCPDDQKAPYKLYRDFLIRLSPATVDVDYADYRLPITSRKLIIKKNITSLYVNNMPIQLKMIIRKYFLKSWGSYEKDSVIIEAFLKQLDCCEQLGNYMATDIIRKNLKTFNKQQIDILFTIVSLIEAASCNHSTLHDYLEGDFF